MKLGLVTVVCFTKGCLSKFLLMDDILPTIIQWHHSIELLIEDSNFLIEVLHTFPDTPPVVTGSWHDWSQLQRLQGLLYPWPRYVVVHWKDLWLNGSPDKKIAAFKLACIESTHYLDIVYKIVLRRGKFEQLTWTFWESVPQPPFAWPWQSPAHCWALPRSGRLWW